LGEWVLVTSPLLFFDADEELIGNGLFLALSLCIKVVVLLGETIVLSPVVVEGVIERKRYIFWEPSRASVIHNIWLGSASGT
jgi:hypothetical protein